jgi:hypothetical protein
MTITTPLRLIIRQEIQRFLTDVLTFTITPWFKQYYTHVRGKIKDFFIINLQSSKFL